LVRKLEIYNIKFIETLVVKKVIFLRDLIYEFTFKKNFKNNFNFLKIYFKKTTKNILKNRFFKKITKYIKSFLFQIFKCFSDILGRNKTFWHYIKLE